jgi:hypothetical protein
MPCTAEEFLRQAVEPALKLLPEPMDSPEAKVMLGAIALQESGLRTRWQLVDPARPWLKGPARGLLQFEVGTEISRGGCWGVFLHPASRFWLRELCKQRSCVFEPSAIWQAIEVDDVLAAGVARLLLFTDPQPLPALDDQSRAWALYARCWKPGKPRPEKWPGNHAAALAAVRAPVSSTSPRSYS